MNKVTRRLAYCAMLTALAMIFGYVEALLPFNFGVPGIKLGIANIVTVTALYILPAYQALFIQLARIVLVSFLFGNMSMMLYSLAGGCTSFAVMYLLKNIKSLSITGVSMGGGVSHNIGQLIAAVFVVQNFKIAFYLPVLLISGLVTGWLIGMVSCKIKPAIDSHRI